MPDVLDDYELNEDGTVTFNFSGITRVLKRPTLGQYRRLVEALGATKSAIEGDTPTLSIQIDEMVAWLDNVFTTLAGEGLPRKDDAVDEDMLPSWLITAQVVQGIIGQWQMVPNRRGGE